MGTVVGCNTRRYHGVLCAATLPPVGRMMTLNRVGEILYLDGATDRMLELSVNQFKGNLHPRGDRYLRRFEMGDVARWEYEVDGVRVLKELQVCWRQNVAGVRYRIEPAGGRKFRLDLLPFVSLRDFHALRHSGANFDVRGDGDQAAVREGTHAVHLRANAGRFTPGGDWWYGHVYPIETERGQDDTEDLFCPGRFTFEADGPAGVTLWASVEPLVQLPDWNEQLRRRDAFRQQARRSATSAAAPKSAGSTPAAIAPDERSPTIRRLLHAAEDFVVYRKNPDGSDGTTVIAGYPWFSDWGRDTFISLPGLLLVPGRFEEAKQVLRVFGSYVTDGMIPNRFDDYTSEPSYNTVDASLWYIHSAFEYLRLSKDANGFNKWMLPACRQIIDGYRRGTRFNIRMESDGLITQGDASTQLTWMDAKCGGVAFTPRQGKPVEINALWHHALVLMGEKQLAAKVADSFRAAFWISPFRGLADVVNEQGQDRSVRPNQIYAVSVPNSPLDDEQQRAVVEVVRRELLTPVGLRTLARGDPKYRGRYCGPQQERDGCYHNGTVWAWLIGGFLEAYLKVNRKSAESIEQARRWLRPLVDHLEQNCIGQIAEIFEGDEPHRPVGCPAQAWSVAEVLRMAVELKM
jgi:predicted glycogen debranching enzyme